jgi:cyclopropane-fatty-acyl-phospholipid synthase
MFEHVSNWPALLRRVRSWLEPGGLLFMHVFSHARAPYRFDHSDPSDWIAQHFFTGGIMPSHGLIGEFDSLFEVAESWRWSGSNYARTANDWLANFDRNANDIAGVLGATYGDRASLWQRRWRLFLLATAGLFGHRGGEEWGVSHYLLRPAR